MIADSSIPSHRPKQILTLNDLYPYINTLHCVDRPQDPTTAAAHRAFDQKLAAHAASH